MKRYPIIILISLIGFFSNSSPLHAFLPYVKNYTRDTYDAASQNWAVRQDSKGFIYVGNHGGLLVYDGCNWNLYPLKGKTIIRSVYIDTNDRIYVGSYEEFGYFEWDRYGGLIYTSLSETVNPSLLHNKQIWSIERIDNNIYFQSFGGFFVLHDGEIKFNKTPFQLFMLQNVNGRIYTPSNGKLFGFDGVEFTTKDEGRFHFHIKTIIPYNDKSMLVMTEADGIWLYQDGKYSKWRNDIENELEWANPNRAKITNDSLILVGTVLNGLYALDKKGSLVWHLNSENGLQNNTILGITCDRENNIWLALDNGVSVVYNTQFLKVNRWNNKNVGSIYDLALFGDNIYIATNQGLFSINAQALDKDNKNNKIELVPGAEGFVLELHKTNDDKLLIGHSKKTLMLDRNKNLTKLVNKGGGMSTKNLTIDGQNYLIQSTYTTFNIYKYEPQTSKWTFRNELKNFSNPIRFFEPDHNGIIWAAHSSKGLYKIEVDKGYNNVLSSVYYPSLDSTTTAKIGVFAFKNRIVFTDENRCYTYDDLSNSIVPYDYLNNNIGHFATAHRIVHVNNNLYWFITKRDAALISFEGEKPNILNTVVYQNYSFMMLDNFEKIVPISDEYSLLCYHNGVAQIFHNEKNNTKATGSSLTLVSAIAYNANNNKEPLILELIPESELSLSYSYNSIRFKVAYPVFEQPFRIIYRLKGLSDKWETSLDGTIEYMRLPNGNYILEVATESAKGEIVASTSYPFYIRPPFYASPIAYILYALLLMATLFAIYAISKRRALNTSKKLREKQEREIIKLENEKLSDEITFKSKELAGSAMNLIRKSELLLTLKMELEKQKEQLGTQYPNKYYNRMMSIVENNLSSTQEWEIFQTNFDRIHENFFRNLRKEYPELSSSDLKLCALLRLNLDNKEMANMMNITIRGIETRRYRLRRKLNLSPTDNLTEFLIDFK